jgi:hypothetical protein
MLGKSSEEQSTQLTAQMQQAIGAYAHNKSQPNLDAAMALSHYRDKMTSVNFKPYTVSNLPSVFQKSPLMRAILHSPMHSMISPSLIVG